MNPNQPPSGQNPAQYMPQYAGYMPTAPAGFYPSVYPAYPAYGGYPASTMDAQYMGYYGMAPALPAATTLPTSQTGSTPNSQGTAGQQDFQKQYEEWKKQYDQWLEKTKDHPDQQQFQQWQQQMQQWEQHLTQVLPQQPATTIQQTAPPLPAQPTTGAQAAYSSKTVQSSQASYTGQTSYLGQTGQSGQAGYLGQTGQQMSQYGRSTSQQIGPQQPNTAQTSQNFGKQQKSGQYQQSGQQSSGYQSEYQDQNYQQNYNQSQRPNAMSQFHNNSQSNQSNYSKSQGQPSWQQASQGEPGNMQQSYGQTSGQVNQYGTSEPPQQQSHDQNRFSHPSGGTQYGQPNLGKNPQAPSQSGQYQQRATGFSPRGPGPSKGPPPQGQQAGQWPRGPTPRTQGPRVPMPRDSPGQGLRGPMPRGSPGQGPRPQVPRSPGQDQHNNRPPFPDQFQGSRFRGPRPQGQSEQLSQGQGPVNQSLGQRPTQPRGTERLNQRLSRPPGPHGQDDQTPRMRTPRPQDSEVQSNMLTPRVPMNQHGPRPLRSQGTGGSFDQEGHALRGPSPQTPTSQQVSRMPPPTAEGAGHPSYHQSPREPRAQYNNQQGPRARPPRPQGPGVSLNQVSPRTRLPGPQGAGLQGPRARTLSAQTLSGQQETGMRPQEPGGFTDQRGLQIGPPRPQGTQGPRARGPSPQTSTGLQGTRMQRPTSQGPAGFTDQQSLQIRSPRPQGMQGPRTRGPSPQNSTGQQGTGMRPVAPQEPAGFADQQGLSIRPPRVQGMQGPRARAPSPQTSTSQQGTRMQRPTSQGTAGFTDQQGLQIRPSKQQGAGMQVPRARGPSPQTLSGQQSTRMQPPTSQELAGFTDQQGLRIRPPRPQVAGMQGPRARAPSPQTSTAQQGTRMQPPTSQIPAGFTDQRGLKIRPPRPQGAGMQGPRARAPSPQTSTAQQGIRMQPPTSQGPAGFTDQRGLRIRPPKPQGAGMQGPRARAPSAQTLTGQPGTRMQLPTYQGPAGFTDQQGLGVRPPRPQGADMQGPRARAPSPQTSTAQQGTRMRPPITHAAPGIQQSPQMRAPTPETQNQQGPRAKVPSPQTTSNQQGPRGPSPQTSDQQFPRLRIPRPPGPRNLLETKSPVSEAQSSQQTSQAPQALVNQQPRLGTPNQNNLPPSMPTQIMSEPRLRLPVVPRPHGPSPTQISQDTTSKEGEKPPSAENEKQPLDSVHAGKDANLTSTTQVQNNISNQSKVPEKTEETFERKGHDAKNQTDLAPDVTDLKPADIKDKKQLEIELLMRQQEQLKNLEMLGMLQQKQKAMTENQAPMTENQTPEAPKESADKTSPVKNVEVERHEERMPKNRPVYGADKTDESMVLCKKFPRCGLAEDCQFYHPLCKYDVNCKRPECPFWHTVPLKERSCGKKLLGNKDRYDDPRSLYNEPYDERDRLRPPEDLEYRRLHPDDDPYYNNRRDYPPADYYGEGYHDRGLPPPERDDLGRPPYDDPRGRILDYGYVDDGYPPPREYDRYPGDDRYPDRERYSDERPYLEEPFYDRGRYPEETRYPDEGRYPDEERRPMREQFDDPYYERERLYRDPDAEYFRRQEERELIKRSLDRKLDMDPYLSEPDYRERELYRRGDPYDDPYYRLDPLYDRRRPYDHFDDLDRRHDVGRDRYDDLFPDSGPRDYRHGAHRDPVETVLTGREALLQSKSIDYRHGWREEERERRREGRYGRDYPPKPALPPPKPRSKVVAIGDLLDAPGRDTRPDRVVFIFRGVPGSGKTHVARLIKDKEVSCGAHAPRILSLDDYFLQETSKQEEDAETGKKVEVKGTEYVYEAELEESYRKSLFKSFNKTLDDGFFPMVILDCINDKVDHFDHFWSIAKQKGFEVYVADMTADANDCAKRNTHNRSLEDINKILETWEETPAHYIRLDVRSLLQDAAIEEVEMEAVEEPDASKEGKGDAKQEKDAEDEGEHEDSLFKSRWNDTDVTEKTLDKLDGIRPRGTKRKSHNSPLAEDFDDDPYDEREEDMRLGKKRVRWADIEERKHLEHRRKIGFCIGTDWSILTNPDAEIPQ